MRKLIEKRVRHLNKIVLWNVRLTIKLHNLTDSSSFVGTNLSGSNLSIPNLLKDKDNNNNIENFQSLNGLDCFVILETLEGEIFHISETQTSSLASVTFNDFKIINHKFNTLDKFILRINVSMPTELMKGQIATEGNKDIEFTNIVSYLIDLNENLVKFDLELDDLDNYNVPVLRINKDYFTLGNWVNKKSKYSNDFGITDDITKKRSINFTTLLKFNKMIEYGNNLSLERSQISRDIEQFIIKNHNQLNKQSNFEIDNIKDYINQMNDNIQKKRKLIQNLQKLIDDADNKNNVILNHDADNKSSNDEYGTTYANYYQIKDKINFVKCKRLNQVIKLFNMILNNELLSFFHIYKDKDNNRLGDLDDNSNKVNKDTKDDSRTVILNLLNIDNLISAMEKDGQMDYINSQIGYYILFLNILSQRIYQIQLPYTLRYCGSTSTINNKYPLFMTDLQSHRQLQQFDIAVNLININIKQLNQFLCI